MSRRKTLDLSNKAFAKAIKGTLSMATSSDRCRVFRSFSRTGFRCRELDRDTPHLWRSQRYDFLSDGNESHVSVLITLLSEIVNKEPPKVSAEILADCWKEADKNSNGELTFVTRKCGGSKVVVFEPYDQRRLDNMERYINSLTREFYSLWMAVLADANSIFKDGNPFPEGLESRLAALEKAGPEAIDALYSLDATDSEKDHQDRLCDAWAGAMESIRMEG